MNADDVWHVTAPDEDSMLALGRELAEAALPLPPGGLLIDLRGELGLGKTVFARGLARGLGVPARIPIVSPTFTIARAYAGAGPGACGVTFHHLDAYRLSGPEELEAMGFEEMWGDRALTCVEWGMRVVEAFPEDRMEVRLDMQVGAGGGGNEPTTPGAIPVFPRHVSVRARGPASRAVLLAWRRRHAPHAAERARS